MRLLDTHEENDLARLDSRAFKFKVSEHVKCLISISAVSNAHGTPHPPTNQQINHAFLSEIRLLLTNGLFDGRSIPCITHFNFVAYTLPRDKTHTIVLSIAALDEDSIVSRIPTDAEIAAAIQGMTNAVMDKYDHS